MKKGIFYFILTVAILFANASYGQLVKQINPTCHCVNKVSYSLLTISKSDNFSSNQYLIDATDDDLNESEKKAVLLQKSSIKSVVNFLYLIRLDHINNFFSKRFFFQLHASLFLFIKVFRL